MVDAGDFQVLRLRTFAAQELKHAARVENRHISVCTPVLNSNWYALAILRHEQLVAVAVHRALDKRQNRRLCLSPEGVRHVFLNR